MDIPDWRRCGWGIATFFLALLGSIGIFCDLRTDAHEVREIGYATPKDPLRLPGTFELRPDAGLSFPDLDENERRLTRLRFRARALEAGSTLELTFRAGERGAYQLTLRFADRLAAELSRVSRPGESEPIAVGAIEHAGGAIELSLCCDDDRIAVLAGDAPILAAVRDGPRSGRLAMRATSGRVAVDRFAATGIDAAGAPYSFVGPDAPSGGFARLAKRAIYPVVAVLALVGFLFRRGGSGAGRVVAAALAAVLAVVALDRATRRDLAEVDVDRFVTAKATPGGEGFRLDGPTVLDASNSLVVPGPFSRATVTLRATLSRDAVLEVRMRSSTTRAAGVAWVGSARESLGCGFVRQETMRSSAIGSRGKALPADREVDLAITCDGAGYVAKVDGDEISRAEDGRFAAGPIVLLAAAGSATIRAVAVATEAPRDPPEWARNGLVAAIAFLLAAAASLVVLARHRLEDALGLGAIALLPCAGLQAAPALQRDLFAIAIAAFLVLLLASQVRARQIGLLRAHLALGFWLVIAPCGVLAIAMSAPLAVETQEMGAMRLERDLVHFQHPAARQLNDYLAQHRFRGREHTLARRPGTQRVLCIGTSSTWGHGFEDGSGSDYPTILERRLRAAGRAVDTMNAAYPGTHAHCLERVLSDQLRDFEFDVVTVSLTYNDSYFTTQSDGHGDLERLIGLHPWPRAIVNARARSAVLPARIEMQRLIAKFDAGGISTTEAWRALGHREDVPIPVARFESSLRRMAETAARRGARIVFMKEPLRGDQRMIWKEEFRAAIDRVAADHGGYVADPTPALLAFRGPRLFQDDVHPTAEGNEIVAAALEGVVARALDAR